MTQPSKWRLYLPAIAASLFVFSVLGMLVGEILLAVRSGYRTG